MEGPSQKWKDVAKGKGEWSAWEVSSYKTWFD